jgi:hypothetical protein
VSKLLRIALVAKHAERSSKSGYLGLLLDDKLISGSSALATLVTLPDDVGIVHLLQNLGLNCVFSVLVVQRSSKGIVVRSQLLQGSFAIGVVSGASRRHLTV